MNLQERIAKACQDEGNVSYRSYSGRGMYGKECVGITGSLNDCMKIIGIVINEHAQELFDDAINCSDDSVNSVYDDRDTFQDDVESLMKFRMDNMGLDVVVYWPPMQYLEVEGYYEDDEG